MSQITARWPDAVADALGAVASRLKRSRVEIIRQAVERYLEDFDDLSVAVDRLAENPFLGSALKGELRGLR